ncbi:unnamed protein product, partial [Heterosigma akashiwo]
AGRAHPPVLHDDGPGHGGGAAVQRPHGGRALRAGGAHRGLALLRGLRAGAAGLERLGAAGLLQLRAQEDLQDDLGLHGRAGGRGLHEQHLLPGRVHAAGAGQGAGLGVQRRDDLHPLRGGGYGALRAQEGTHFAGWGVDCQFVPDFSGFGCKHGSCRDELVMIIIIQTASIILSFSRSM